MLQNISRLVSVVNGKRGSFDCDHDTPLPDIKEMLFQFQKFVGQVEDNARQQQELSKEIVVEEVQQEEV